MRWAVLLVTVALEARAADAPQVRIRWEPYSPPPVILKVESKLVEVGVVVRDSSGHPVGGLEKGEFSLLDNGHPEQISYFYEDRRAAQPKAEANNSRNRPAITANAQTAPHQRSIVLFFDDTHSELFALQKAREGAEKLLNASEGWAADRFAIFTASGKVTVEFTSDRATLIANLAKLGSHVEHTERPITTCPTLTPYEAFVIARRLDETLRRRAVAETVACNCSSPDPACIRAQEQKVQDMAETIWEQYQYPSSNALAMMTLAAGYLAKAPGDRIFLMLSPGFITDGMDKQASKFIDVALRARIIVNSLDAEGLRTMGSDALHQLIVTEVLSSAAEATGGRFIHNSNDFASDFAKLTEVPEITYILGFVPSGPPDGKYHHLKLVLNGGGKYDLEYRRSYFSNSATVEETAQQRIDNEVLSQDTLNGLPTKVRVSSEGATDGQMVVKVAIHIDPQGLKFAKQNGRHLEQLTFVTVIRDGKGNYLAGKESTMDLALLPDKLSEFETKGVTASVSFMLPRGSYQVREVVRELTQNRLSAMNTTFQVP